MKIKQQGVQINCPHCKTVILTETGKPFKCNCCEGIWEVELYLVQEPKYSQKELAKGELEKKRGNFSVGERTKLLSAPVSLTCSKTFTGRNGEDTPCGMPTGHFGKCSNGARGR